MRDEQYRRWLEGKQLSSKTISSQLSSSRRIERAENLSLDEEYERDGLASLIESYTYSAADERRGRGNPTAAHIEATNLRPTLASLRAAIEQYRKFCDEIDVGIVDEVADDAPTNAVDNLKFGLERDLQSALRSNIEQLEPGLRIIDDGRERRVDTGYIDILAQDQQGQTVVIELKAETGRASSIAQVLGYMGALSTELEGNIRGILVAAEFDPRAEMAARAVPNLSLRRYSFRFEFQ